MKSPKIPAPVPEKAPTAPLLNRAGTYDAIDKQKKQQGFLSTFLGGNKGSMSSRLSQYLGSNSVVPQGRTVNTNKAEQAS